MNGKECSTLCSKGEPCSITKSGVCDAENKVECLGWSRKQAEETRQKFRTFENDWNAPGMEAYDSL